MQFLRLSLEHWRGVEARELVFAAGVNIVEGANEAGKSSFIEALNLLFRERDSSKKKEIRAITPKGKDVGSTVSLEFNVGEFHLTYTKTFNRRSATSLLMHKPEIRQFTGLEAHEKVLSIMDSAVDFGLWQALQLEQGGEFSEINLRQSGGLTAALDAAAGGAGVVDDNSGLIDLAKREFLKYFTERTARETGELLATRDACAALREAESQSLTQLQGMQTQIERSAALSEKLRDNDLHLPELTQSLKAAQDRLQAVEALEDKQNLLRAQVEAQQLKLHACEQTIADRQLLQKSINTQQQAIVSTQQTIDELDLQIKSAREQLQSSLVLRDSLKKQRREVDATVDLLNKELLRLAERAELQALTARHEQYLATHREIDSDRKTRAAIVVTDKDLNTLESLDQERRALEIRLAARQPELTVTANAPLAVGSRSLDAGQTMPLDTSADFVVTIGDSASLMFKPAVDLEDLQAELNRVTAKIAQDFERLNVVSLQQVQTRLIQKVELDQRLDNLQQRLQQIVDGSVESLVARLEQLRALQPEDVSDRDSASVRSDIAERQSAAINLDSRIATLNTDFEIAQKHLAALEARSAMLVERLASDRKQHEMALSAAAADSETDEAINARRHVELTMLAQLQQQLHEVVAEVDVADSAAVTAQCQSAQLALERAQKQQHADEKELAAVNAMLEQLKTEGLHEKLERLRADRTDAEEQLAVIARAAEAAKCLWETLCRHQRDTRLSYAKPLSERVADLGRLVFGRDFSVQLNESLVIESRTLHGATVPFSDLSGGAKEQLGILLRLGAAQLVTGLPLILDDTLGHTDAQRLQTMGALLSAAGRDSQIVIMTCYPQRYRHVGDAEVHRLQDESGTSLLI